jgi:excinuclease ABC subunit C
LQRIRDEAHRFAIAYHRSLRAKQTIQTELTDIKGIGPKTAKKLLLTFGSAAKVRAASQDELAAAVGASNAAKIIAHRSAENP